MKKLVLAIALVLGAVSAKAQIVEDWPNFLNTVAINVETATDGLGIGVAAPVNQHIQVRAGINFMPEFKVKQTVDLSSVTPSTPLPYGVPKSIDIEGKPSMTEFSMLADLFPSKNSSFHFTVGFYIGKSVLAEAYNITNQPDLKDIYKYNQQYPNNRIGAKIGDYLIEPDENGNVKAELKVNSFKPYLGLGFGRAVPRKRVSVQGEIGCQFWGTPAIYAQNEELKKSANGDSSDKFFDLLSKVTVYPMLKLRVCGRIF